MPCAQRLLLRLVLTFALLLACASLATAIFDVRSLISKVSSAKGSSIEHSYTFDDARRKRHEITIVIPGAVIEESNSRYGYSKKDLYQELVKEAEQFTQRHKGIFKVSVTKDLGYQYRYKKGYEHLAAEYKSNAENVMKNYYQARFLTLANSVYSIDYPAVQQWQYPFVKNVYEKLKDEAHRGEMNEREFITLLANFVQNLKYKVPPARRGDYEILGFWPPVTCLNEKAGDCDSKSTLFATLLSHYRKAASILILTERHAFIGIKDQHRTFPMDRVQRVGGRDFLLVEMTNPAEMGKISSKEMAHLRDGRYRYISFN